MPRVKHKRSSCSQISQTLHEKIEPDVNSCSEMEEPQVANDFASLQTILQELREFSCENIAELKAIKNEMTKTTTRVDQAEKVIWSVGRNHV